MLDDSVYENGADAEFKLQDSIKDTIIQFCKFVKEETKDAVDREKKRLTHLIDLAKAYMTEGPLAGILTGDREVEIKKRLDGRYIGFCPICVEEILLSDVDGVPSNSNYYKRVAPCFEKEQERLAIQQAKEKAKAAAEKKRVKNKERRERLKSRKAENI
jgi:hypothetical protein